VTWRVSTRIRRAPLARSIAPPIPIIFPVGIHQFARSPPIDTCIAPRIARSTWPPRIIAKLVAESKKLPPGTTVTVCLPALMSWGSSSPSMGKGPIPSSPFSLWNQTSAPSGR